jgi:energy-coupling factor transporter ATP-binding protein EcfA2
MIKGFKSLKDVSLDVKPLTVLIGLNSSGKSSVLQFLEVLKQSTLPGVKTSYLKTDGPLIDLGSFDDVVMKDGDGTIAFHIEGKMKSLGREILVLAIPPSRLQYDYYCEIDKDGVRMSSFGFGEGNFGLSGKFERGKSEQTETLVQGNRIAFSTSDAIGQPFVMVQSAAPYHITSLIRDKIVQAIPCDLNMFFLVPAMRGVNSPRYPLDSKASDDLIDASNLYSQAMKFSSTVVYDSTVMETKISKWIHGITGVSVKARTVPDKQASVEVSKRFDVNVVNEGFGTNQLVHLFAQIAKAPAHSLIGVEEPETHLHPKAQSELAKSLINIAKEEKKNLILTTHSEHLLYRFLIEIAKGNLRREDFALYHFSLSEDGVTRCERLVPDEKGRLNKGIPDFFETELSEFRDLLETLRA